jgi:hypothetical protein
MVATKYIYKYQVISDRPDFKLNKKYVSIKKIIEDLKDSPLELKSRTSIYGIMYDKGYNYKFHDVKIYKIHEKIKTKLVRVILEEN